MGGRSVNVDRLDAVLLSGGYRPRPCPFSGEDIVTRRRLHS